VEDFTGRGIDDMRQGIIRTPLPAKETFLDGEDACHDVNAVIAVRNYI
jgi:tRNA nucleotidyltransferase/poly(A) polymerase